MDLVNVMPWVGKQLSKQMKPKCEYCIRISTRTITTANGKEPVCEYHEVELTEI